MKRALVLGAGGFIGSHLVKQLKNEGYWVRGCDLKKPEFSQSAADEFVLGDLTDRRVVEGVLSIENEVFDEIYQLAADMGGAGFIFTGEHDAEIMRNSALINLNLLNEVQLRNLLLNVNLTKIFYSSSACIYPEFNQVDPMNPNCSEDSAYPALPDSEYGWEKLFSERLYFAFHRNYGIPVRIARFHNIYGPEGTWQGGREKAPAAICRKVAQSRSNESIEIWGDGNQTRSFLYIGECLKGIRSLMQHPDFIGPVNIGSEEMISINSLVELVAKIAEKNISIHHVDGPLGVRGRNSDNTLAREKLNWDNSSTLEAGLASTYFWIEDQLTLGKKDS